MQHFVRLPTLHLKCNIKPRGDDSGPGALKKIGFGGRRDGSSRGFSRASITGAAYSIDGGWTAQ
jgi:hypothetical protein